MRASHRAAAFLAFLVCILAAVNISAATLVVTKTEDTNDGVCDADCSLREAVAGAATDDTVVFSSLFNTPQTITLTLGQIAITRNLTINGPGQYILAINGNNASRIFRISGGSNVGVSGMKLTNGLASGVADAVGGAVYLFASSLNLTNTIIANNVARQAGQPATGSGGGIFVDSGSLTIVNSAINNNTAAAAPLGGGGIYSIHGTVSITDSTVNSNVNGGVRGLGDTSTPSDIIVNNCSFLNNIGSAIQNGGSGRTTVIDSIIRNNGGGIGGGGSLSMLTIDRSMVSDNQPLGGVGNSGTATIANSMIRNNFNNRIGGSGGGIGNVGTMYVVNSSIINNRAFESGGGIYNVLGRIYLTNSTISGNLADNGSGNCACPGGGIYNQWDQINPGGTVVLTNSTVTNNRAAGTGGGIRQDAGGALIMRNTIVAGNTSFTIQIDVSGPAQSAGFNLVGNTTGSSGWLTSDILNMNPALAPLGNNGGPTPTHAVLPASPAIDAGNNELARDPYTKLLLVFDQRAFGFARIVGSSVDIGAYEANYAPDPVTLGGRVLVTANGRGVSKAVMTLTDAVGNVSYTQTNPFGYYRFLNLPPGTTYTVRVSHKSYQFDSPQVVTIDQPRDNLDFVAQGQ
jgi:CSLREA domain-containing protein